MGISRTIKVVSLVSVLAGGLFLYQNLTPGKLLNKEVVMVQSQQVKIGDSEIDLGSIQQYSSSFVSTSVWNLSSVDGDISYKLTGRVQMQDPSLTFTNPIMNWDVLFADMTKALPEMSTTASTITTASTLTYVTNYVLPSGLKPIEGTTTIPSEQLSSWTFYVNTAYLGAHKIVYRLTSGSGVYNVTLKYVVTNAPPTVIAKLDKQVSFGKPSGAGIYAGKFRVGEQNKVNLKLLNIGANTAVTKLTKTLSNASVVKWPTYLGGYKSTDVELSLLTDSPGTKTTFIQMKVSGNNYFNVPLSWDVY